METTCKDEKQHVILNATTKIQEYLRKIEHTTRSCCPPDFGIRIKNIVIMNGVLTVPWHPTLIKVLEWFDREYPDKIVITSAYRKGSGARGVHGTNPLRGNDLRSREFVDPIIVQDHCNEIWDYGDGKHSVCIYHRTARCKNCKNKFEVNPEEGVVGTTVCPKCGTGAKYIKDFGPHFHIQVRDETGRRD